MAQINATTYGERIKNEITDGIEITDTLEQVIISDLPPVQPTVCISERRKSV